MGCLRLTYYQQERDLEKSPLFLVKSLEENLGQKKKSVSCYGYGFNGKESDNEISGNGNSYDYGFRIYNPRIAKFLSVDPMAHLRTWVSPYNFVQNNPINRVDPTGALDTKYEDEAGNLLLETNDGSDDVVTVSNDKVEDFKFYGESYKNDGMKPVYDSKAWNDHHKSEFLGFESPTDMNNTLGQFTTQWSRQNAIDFLQDPSIGNAMAMSASEALSQWTDPEKLMMAATIFVGGMPVRGGTNAFKHSYKYAGRVRARGLQDPVSHNFPYSFDDAILNTKPMLKNNGYNMYQLNGTMNGKNGVFEIGLTKSGVIDHRFFRPTK